jgi:predicted anti-sigma-YlaC factor YlaD
MDGEPVETPQGLLDEHVASCVGCAQWAERAAVLTRQLRLGTAEVPDLTERIVADVVLPVRKVMRRRVVLRAGLVLVGLVQLGLSLGELSGDDMGMAMSTHASHEGAAWNLAIAVAFLATAVRPRRAAGLIALLASFVVVLGALSIHDIMAGIVSVDRLATHIAAVVGLVLLFAVDRAERALPPARFADVEGEKDETKPKDQHRRRHLRGVA